jgi:hypothetical protein
MTSYRIERPIYDTKVTHRAHCPDIYSVDLDGEIGFRAQQTSSVDDNELRFGSLMFETAAATPLEDVPDAEFCCIQYSLDFFQDEMDIYLGVIRIQMN